jgi:hypothetical protein
MSALKEKTADIVDHIEDIAETYYRLTIVNATQKATSLASSVVIMLIIAALGMFVLVFLAIALAIWLGDVIGSRSGGFLLSAGIFLVVLGIILLLRKPIVNSIRDLIVRKIYE